MEDVLGFGSCPGERAATSRGHGTEQATVGSDREDGARGIDGAFPR